MKTRDSLKLLGIEYRLASVQKNKTYFQCDNIRLIVRPRSEYGRHITSGLNLIEPTPEMLKQALIKASNNNVDTINIYENEV